MTGEQRKKLWGAIRNFTQVRVDAVAAQYGSPEDVVQRELEERRVPLFHRGGVLWAQGSRPHWTVKEKPDHGE